MAEWEQLANQESIERAVSALRGNGFEVFVVENGEEAKKKVFEKIPIGAEVMNMTSMTLETINVAKEIEESSKFISVRKKLITMRKPEPDHEMRCLGAAPEWAVGSVHAVTEDGHILIASKTGSQLPAYAYGAGTVIWVVGIQKIVKDTDEGIKRIYDCCLPLENERAKKAYGIESEVNKILIVNKEIQKGRITIILVKEKLGF